MRDADSEDDYGIDLEVEIFGEADETGQRPTTGLTFKVQAKGAEGPDRIGPFVDIQLKHLRYWRSLDVPVLLFLYLEETGLRQMDPCGEQ